MKEESNNKGCGIIGIAVVFLCIWGFMGMMDGGSFTGGIFSSVKSLLILAVVALAIYGLIKLKD